MIVMTTGSSSRVYIYAGCHISSLPVLCFSLSSRCAIRLAFPFISQSSQYSICLDFPGICFLSICPYVTFSGNASWRRTVLRPFRPASLCKARHGSKIRLSLRDTCISKRFDTSASFRYTAAPACLKIRRASLKTCHCRAFTSVSTGTNAQ